MISHFLTLFLSAYVTSGAVLTPPNISMNPLSEKQMNSSKSIAVLPVQPVLIHPTVTPAARYQGRALIKDDQIIYIKLLQRKSYRPKKVANQKEKYYPKDVQMKDIFYVKVMTNGQFSHNRLKIYHLPEFYVITVYKKGQLK